MFGIPGLTGLDFGRPALSTVAPGLTVLGVLLVCPFSFGFVRTVRQQPPWAQQDAGR